MAEPIEDLRLLALGDAADSSQDARLALLYNFAVARFLLVLRRARRIHAVPEPDKPKAIPEELSWILSEVVVKRFNRIGSEGMTSEAVEGHSVTFEADDFAEYAGIIDDFYAEGDTLNGRRPGRVVIY